MGLNNRRIDIESKHGKVGFSNARTPHLFFTALFPEPFLKQTDKYD